MAEYGFEGDLTGITDTQLQYINTALSNGGLKDRQTKVFFEPVGAAGDNYVADVKRITIEGENRKLSLIAKIAPTNEKLREFMNASRAFKNEHIMYTKVLPRFTALEQAAGVPDEQRFRYAKCYGSLSEQPNEVILLEDLKSSDFSMLNRLESLSDACVKSVLENFAKLHSLSYALKKQEPETYDLSTKGLIDMWTVLTSVKDSQIFIEQMENEVIQVLDSVEHKNIVRHKMVEIPNVAAKLADVAGGSKHSVIQQGDSWTNNIMFKTKDDSKIQSIMIDYQLAKEGNPCGDLLYMIFNCTDAETRTKHYLEWIDYYYTELDKALSNFGLKAISVYPRDQLDADLRRYGKLIFGLSVLLASVLSRKSEEALNINDVIEQNKSDTMQTAESLQMNNLDDETVKRLKYRVAGLISSFNEFGLL